MSEVHALPDFSEVDECVRELYDINSLLHKGAEHKYYTATCKATGDTVVIKLCYDANKIALEAEKTIREAMFLQEFQEHENIINLHYILRPESCVDVYQVLDYMESDLRSAIRANILEDIHKKFITYQLLKAVRYMHSGNVIHRNLKPDKIYIDSECNIKIHGLQKARIVDKSTGTYMDPPEPARCGYVSTRWYKSPETLLGAPYSKPYDMWAVGCILGELITGNPTFPGRSTMNQLERIVECTGMPSDETIDLLDTPFANIMFEYMIEPIQTKTFSELFPEADEEALDLLQKLLAFLPAHRISARSALKHPYLAEFYDKTEIVTFNYRVKLSVDARKYKNSTREKFYQQIENRFHSKRHKSARK